MGFQIVGISPDTPAELAKTSKLHDLRYKLLSDSRADAIKSLGLAFKVDDNTVAMYKERFNLDLERSSGETHHILPVPAVLIVDRAGTIQFVHFDPDYKKRISRKDLLEAAAKVRL